MPDTLRSVTGGGGRHLFYLTPPGLVIPSLRGWMTGIDIRVRRRVCDLAGRQAQERHAIPLDQPG